MKHTLYPGVPFSPQATLTNNIGAADTIIAVSDVSAFPPAPNLATIGADEGGETILYTAKTADALSGCQRGVEGTAKAWMAGELIGRNFTAKDHNDLIAAVSGAIDAAGAAQSTADSAASDAKSAQVAADDANQRITSPNLLDNWYFVNPINERGEKKYQGSVYAIDRWKMWTESDTMIVNNGYITLDKCYACVQFLDDPGKYTGLTLTFSVLYRTTSPNFLMQIYGNKDTVNPAVTLPQASDWAIASTTKIITGENTVLRASIGEANRNSAIDILAVKLEIGSTQTLAHQDENGNWVLNDPPPNYALELAKCQRYQLAGSMRAVPVAMLSSYQCITFLPTPVTLRGIPTIVADYEVRSPNNETIFTDGHIQHINFCQNGLEIIINSVSTPCFIFFKEGTVLDANL